jgi:hypothetical protein
MNADQLMRSFLLSCVVMLTTLGVRGQGLEIHVFGGGNLTDRFDVNGGTAWVYGSALFGASIWYQTNNHFGFEFEYLRQSTSAEVRSTQLFDSDIPIALNYILAGGHWLFELENAERLDFNLGVKAGAVGFLPQTDRYDNGWQFATGFNAGAKYYLTDRIGIRLQFHILIPIQFAADGFWFGNGGSGVRSTGLATITQLGMVGGVFYRFPS